jgi:hypothetical protein
MKHIFIIVIAVLLFSCNENKKIEGERINRFENSLGEKETKYLNEIVRDFDSYLMTKFKDKKSESEFKQYLTELSESENPDFWKIDNIKLDKYLNSNLFAKYDSIYPDTVWYDNNVINVSFASSIGIANSIAPIKRKNQELNIDSLINSIKTQPRLNEIEPSYFQIALESIMTEDSLVLNYIDAKQAAGTISSRLIASGLIYNLSPETEYFAKRIMIMEMND